MQQRYSDRRGAVSHILIALAAAAVGAALAGSLRSSVRLLNITTHGEWIKVATPSGDSLRAYIAYPERKSAAPAVIVIHEIFGLTEWEPTVVDRLAKAGYVAIVPDLLSSRFGRTPADADSGRALISQLTPEGITTDLDAVLGFLQRLPAVRRDQIGVIGFCWGGGQSFRYATNNSRLRAAVVCYGPAPDSSALTRLKVPVLGIYGEHDARINAALPGVEKQLRAQGATFQRHQFPGTGHGFLKPGRQGSDGPQVERAWKQILAFYRTTLDQRPRKTK